MNKLGPVIRPHELITDSLAFVAVACLGFGQAFVLGFVFDLGFVIGLDSVAVLDLDYGLG